MLVSVVVATRNRPELLRATLLALKTQTHQALEVIVLDDGSSSDTRAQYASLWRDLDERFRLVQQGQDGQRGQGPSASRNQAIQHTQGQLVAFCDDDDIWIDNEHLARTVAAFGSHPELDLYISNQRAVYPDGTVREDWLPRLTARRADMPALAEGSHRVTVEQLSQCGGFAHLNMLLLRRTLLQEVGGFWEGVNYEEDRDLFWRCVDRARLMAYCPGVTSQHHVPDRSKQNNVSMTMPPTDRWLMAAMVCRHIAMSVSSPYIVKLSLQHEGDLLRHLSEHSSQNGRHPTARLLAWQALGAKFTWKWALYCVWLQARSLTSLFLPSR